jgi:hypothetical protein
MKSLKENSKNRKIFGIVEGIEIKEIKYISFRFYFITEDFKIRGLGGKNITSLLIIS